MTELIQVKLLPMEEADRNQFILDNQEAFRYGALEEFGVRDEHFEDGEEIISRRSIEECMDRKGAEIYRIILREEKVGGVVLQINAETKHGVEDFTFACGTGTGATVTALTLLGKVSGEDVAVSVPGGLLRVTVERTGEAVKDLCLTGPTNTVCEGEVLDEAVAALLH